MHTLKSFVSRTAGFLKYVWPFFNIIYEKVNAEQYEKLCRFHWVFQVQLYDKGFL